VGKAAVLLAVLVLGGSPATFGDAGDQATATILHVFYAGGGMWRGCDLPDCGQSNVDWGVDSLTYALWLRWQTAHDPAVPPVMRELLATAPSYPAPCTSTCSSWSDVPEWDAIAALREYQVLNDPAALAKARTAFAFVDGSSVFALGACPDIHYQQPHGQDNQLKTLETDANAIKAALLLYDATGERAYLDAAVSRYAAVRARFLDPKVPLYSVYVFDDGQRCRQVPHRFFASVNGDMIWSGLELARATGEAHYRSEALASGRAVVADLSDATGVFTDLQAENDIVEPLVEGMYALATDTKATFARTWILANAAAALSDRAANGSFGRFFDGPAPTAMTTAWQANGGLALEIAAGALDAGGAVPTRDAWAGARRVNRSVGIGDTVAIHASAVAFYGTLGETCCEAGHARVFIDGRETFDGTGIWQNKSSSGRSIPGTVLFAWRWPRRGVHHIRFAPGVQNGKEGGPFLHITGYLVR